MQAVPQVLFRRALELFKPILQGRTSLFPAKREVKREVAKRWQAWGLMDIETFVNLAHYS